MPAIELRQDEIGFYDPEAAKARRERMFGKRTPVVVRLPVRDTRGCKLYEEPIGPTRPDYRVKMANTIREKEYVLSVERWRVLVSIVCERYGVTRDALFSVRRDGNLVAAKQDLWYVASLYCRWSLPQIGRSSGGRDHTTILHGIRKFRMKLEAGLVTSRLLPVIQDAPLFQDQDAASAAIAAE